MYLKMSRTNDESHIRPQPEERARRELDNSMASLWERLEAMCLGNGRGTTCREVETHSLVGGDVNNLLLLELMQKQNEHIQRQSEQLQKMIEARKKAPDGDHPPNDHTNIRGGGGDSKEADEVQDLARDKLK